MQNKRSLIVLILLIITGIFITGCSSGTTIPEEDVGLEVVYDDEMGTVLVNGEKAKPGEELIFEHSSAVNLQAVAIGGSRFLEWSNSGESQTTIDLVLEDDKALIANFLVPLEVSVECNHGDLGYNLEDYIDLDRLVVELVDENGTVVRSREKMLDGGLSDNYSLGLNVNKSNEYDVNVRLLGSNNNSSAGKLKTIYQGSSSDRVELDLQAEPQAGVLKNARVPARPNAAESLTVELSSPDGALEYLESVEIKHVSGQSNRQAIKEYTGGNDQGEVIFIDGEIINGQELQLFPGNWDLTLHFTPSDIDSITEVIRLLPSEEKVKKVSLISEMFEGDLDIGLIWDLPPSAPENVTAGVDGDSIKITWDSVDDAESYNIVRREPDGRDYWASIDETVDLSYLDNDVVSGVTYRYAVVAVNEDGLTSDYGESNLVEMSSK